jgi:hypothetical protein
MSRKGFQRRLVDHLHLPWEGGLRETIEISVRMESFLTKIQMFVV